MFKWIKKAAVWVWKNRDKIEFIIDLLDGDDPNDKAFQAHVQRRIEEKQKENAT